MGLEKVAIKRPTFISALLVVMLILGVVSFGRLSVRMFPDVEFPYVVITTNYRGAGVTEIEQLVTKPIEDALSGVSGLKHSGSISQDGISIVFGEFELSKDSNIAAQEVRDKIAQIRLILPEHIKEPVIIKADINSMPLVSLSLKSESMTPEELYDFADDIVSKDLARVSGISQIKIVGGSKREIHVNVDKEKLKSHELNLTALAAKIKSNTSNIPAGKIDKGPDEISFRTIGELKSIEQINDIVVNFLGNDRPVTVEDVAEVKDGVQSEVSRARLAIREDGKTKYLTSLLIFVYRQAKGNDVSISDGLKKKITEVNKKYEKHNGTPHLTIISDTTRGIRMNLDDVKSTILEGILLAVGVVYLFLGSWRSTFITALALPNSLIGAFIFMYIFGFSLNVISLMSLSLIVGLLVDDAIVVRENIFRHYEEGADPIKSAIEGTSEVTLAIIATTTTVIAVFFPMAFLSGIMGQIFKEFGLTVVFAMSISVLDALTIAPLLSAYIIPDHRKLYKKIGVKPKIIFRVFRFVTVGWFSIVFSFIERSYKELVSLIIKKKIRLFRRYKISLKFITLVISTFIFFGTILVAKKSLKASFMPKIERGEFNIKVVAKPGISLDQMDNYSKQIEKIIMRDKNIELVSSAIGFGNIFSTMSNQTSMYVKMIPSHSKIDFFRVFSKKRNIVKRTRTTSEMEDYLRNLFKEKFGDELEFSITKISHSGNDGESEFIVQLSGENVNILHDVATQLMRKYKKIPHFVDIQSNYKPGKPEIQIKLDPKKMKNFGVSSLTVGNEIRAMIDGASAGVYREGGLEYDIKVNLKNNQKDIIRNFDSLYITNVNNKLVKLENVAFMKKIYGPTQIYRRDKSPYVSIEGNIGIGGAMGEIQKSTEKIFNEEKFSAKNLEKWKNIEYKLSGDSEEMGDMFKSIIKAGSLSLLFIFMVLASLYESVVIPFTIMIALPLAIIGGVIALILSKQYIDIFTMIGMIMLLGIVAKNSILLVDYIQQQMRNGLSIDDSIIQAGTVRLRPILMTSFALIAGMLPTALGFSELGKFRRGMGIVVIGGVVSSTILTLIVVPALFEYMENFRHFLRKLIGRPDKRMIDNSDEQIKRRN
ncbi:MAG: efflux RND transporter permease subunit, partial [Endomicrobium sp.]|nr:efflux RND transporter permease subunit [Endomicrobium sp.]